MNSILLLISLFLVIVAFVRAVSKHRARKSSSQPRKKAPKRASSVPSGSTREERGRQGEAAVNSILKDYCRRTGGQLLDNVTLNFGGGTTQIDHILLTTTGVLVIETKNYSGWIFAGTEDAEWTQVAGKTKYTFQNPLRQNYKHWLAVQDLLKLLPQDFIQDIVVFAGTAEFKTEIPEGVLFLEELKEFLERVNFGRISESSLSRAVTRLESARLEQNEDTERKHIEFLEKTFGRR